MANERTVVRGDTTRGWGGKRHYGKMANVRTECESGTVEMGVERECR